MTAGATADWPDPVADFEELDFWGWGLETTGGAACVVVVGSEILPLPVLVGVLVEPVVPVDPVWPVPVEPGGVVGVVGAEPEAHDSLTLATGTLTGSESEDSGVPAGTLSTNDMWPPPTVVTVTVQVSAEATGTAAIAAHVSMEPAMASTTRSFRLLITVFCLLPLYVDMRSCGERREGVTLLSGVGLCNEEPSLSGRPAGRSPGDSATIAMRSPPLDRSGSGQA